MVGDEYGAIALQGWLGQIANLVQQLQDPNGDSATVQGQLGTIQQQYKTEIEYLSVFATHPQGQGILTEIHRLVRLLNTQGLFLKAARSPAKQQQHRTALADSLAMLLRLGQALDPPPSDPA